MTQTNDLPTPADLRTQDPAPSPAADPSPAPYSSGEAAPEEQQGVPEVSPLEVEEEHAAPLPASLPATGEHDALRASPTTTLKPEHLQELLSSSTPGPWTAFHSSKYDEWHVSVPLEDGSGMTLGLFPDGIETNHREADARLIALAPELAQGYVTLHAAALALVEVDAEHRAWLEATPPGLRGEEHEAFLSRFDAAYSALAQAVGK